MAPPSEFKHIIAIQNRTHTITAAIYNLISIFFSVIRRSDERSVHYAQFFPILPHTNFRFSPKTYQPAYCNLVFLPYTHTNARGQSEFVEFWVSKADMSCQQAPFVFEDRYMRTDSSITSTFFTSPVLWTENRFALILRTFSSYYSYILLTNFELNWAQRRK